MASHHHKQTCSKHSSITHVNKQHIHTGGYTLHCNPTAKGISGTIKCHQDCSEALPELLNKDREKYLRHRALLIKMWKKGQGAADKIGGTYCPFKTGSCPIPDQRVSPFLWRYLETKQFSKNNLCASWQKIRIGRDITGEYFGTHLEQTPNWA